MENVQCDVGDATAFGVLKKMARQSMKRNAMLQLMVGSVEIVCGELTGQARRMRVQESWRTRTE